MKPCQTITEENKPDEKTLTLEVLLCAAQQTETGQLSEKLISKYANCITFLCTVYPELIALSGYTSSHIKKVLKPYLELADSKSGYRHITHPLASDPKLAIFTTLSPMIDMYRQSLPEIRNIIRAMLFVITLVIHRKERLINKIILIPEHLIQLSRVTRDMRHIFPVKFYEYSDNVVTDIPDIIKYFEAENPDISKDRNKAILWLLETFQNLVTDGDCLQKSAEKQQQGKQKHKVNRIYKQNTSLVIAAPGGQDIPKKYLKKGDGLPFDDIVEDPPLTQATRVKSNHEPTSSEIECAKVNRRYEIWVTGIFNESTQRSLTRIEASIATRRLLKISETAIKENDCVQSEASLALLLMLFTSCSTNYAITVANLDKFKDVSSDPEIEGISPTLGLHVFPMPGNEYFWKPKNPNKGIYHQVSNRAQLNLPSELSKLFSLYASSFNLSNGPNLFQSNFEVIHASIIKLTKGLRKKEGLSRFTIERIRLFLPTQLYKVSNDLSIVQMASGHNWGLSTASCHYYCAAIKDLQITYDKATADLFESKVKARKARSFRYNLPMHVGSNMLLQKSEFASFIKKLKAKAGSQARPRKNLRKRLKNLENYTRYTTLMILAGTGHRDSSSLGKITLNDFHTSYNLALIVDKISDPGQRARLIAVPQMLSEQILAYSNECYELEAELQALTKQELTEIFTPAELINISSCIIALKAASTGIGPLLVRLDSELKVMQIKNKWLHDAIPANWDIRTNFLRHNLGTKLRKTTNNPNFIFHQFGHFAFGIQPFGRNGALNPLEFAQSLSADIQEVMEEDGWKLIGRKLAIKDKRSLESNWKQANSFVSQYNKIIEAEREAQRQNILRWKVRKDTAQHDTTNKANHAISTVVPTYTPDKVPVKIHLKDDDVDRIVAILIDDVHENKDQVEWRISSLRNILIFLRNHHEWKTSIPGRVFRQYIEPSPFLIGSISTFKVVEKLQQWTIEDFPSYTIFLNKIGSQKTTPSFDDYQYFKLACSLLFNDGFFKEDRLTSTLVEILKTVRSKLLPATLIIPREIHHKNKFIAEEGICLSGFSAILVASIVANTTSHKSPPMIKTLNNWLFALLPPEMKPKHKHSCWISLAGIVKVGRRFMVSGMKYALEAGEIPTLGLPANDLVVFLDQRPGSKVKKSTKSQEIEAKNSIKPYLGKKKKTHNSPSYNSRRALQDYQLLTGMLHINKSEEKRFPFTNIVLSPKQFKAKLVDALSNELLAWLSSKKQPQNSMVFALAHWALFLLSESGRVDGTGNLKESTTHTYITSIGSPLVELFQKRQLHEYAAEDTETRFYELLLSKSENQRHDVLSNLIRFHTFTIYKFNAEPIDGASLFAIANRMPDFPHVGLMSEYHFERSMDVLNSWASLSNDKTTNARLYRIARTIWLLMYRYGLRISEGHHLRFCDIVSIPDIEHILIQNTNRGTTKTKAGVRSVPSHLRLSKAEVAWIVLWISEESARRYNETTHIDSLFQHFDNPAHLVDRQFLSEIISTAIRWSTQSDRTRPQYGRKSSGSHLMLMCGISMCDYNRLLEGGVLRPITTSKHSSLGEFYEQWTGITVLDNTYPIAVSSALGHTLPSTTNTSYAHLNNLWSTSQLSDVWLKLSGRQKAEFSGVSYVEFRKRCSRKGIKTSDYSAQVSVVIDQIAGPYFNKIYKETFFTSDNRDFPSQPTRKNNIKELLLTDIYEIIKKTEEGAPFDQLIQSYDLPTIEAESLLNSIFKAQLSCDLPLVSTKTLVTAFEALGIAAPTQLTLTDILPSRTRTQVNRLHEVLNRSDKLLREDAIKVKRALKSYHSALRIGDTSLAMHDPYDVRDFIQFLRGLNVSQSNISLNLEVNSNFKEQENNGSLRTNYSSLVGISSEKVKITFSDNRPLSQPPRIIIKIKNEQIRGRPLWVALLILDISQLQNRMPEV